MRSFALASLLCVLLVAHPAVGDVAEDIASFLFTMERDDISLNEAVASFSQKLFPNFDLDKWIHNPITEIASQRIPKALGIMVGNGGACSAKLITPLVPLVKATLAKAQAKVEDLLKAV